MHFKILNRVLGFMFLFSNLVASLPAGNAISQPSALETLESRALSDDSISTAPNTVTDVSVDHNEIPTAAVRQPPATTLATVLSTATSTPAKGSENSKHCSFFRAKFTSHRSVCQRMLQEICIWVITSVRMSARPLAFIILLVLEKMKSEYPLDGQCEWDRYQLKPNRKYEVPHHQPPLLPPSLPLNSHPRSKHWPQPPHRNQRPILSDMLNPTSSASAIVIIYYASDTTLTTTLQPATLQPSPTGTSSSPDTSSMVPLITDSLASPSMSSTVTFGISTPTPLSSETVSLVSSTSVSSTTVSLISPTSASSTTVYVRSSSASTTSTMTLTSTSSAAAAATNFAVELGGLLGAAAGFLAIL
ncbi:hypothetical protein DL98DRAFT_528759 [Cadophora sp. DSE1049]|nr:hypothetical protein DL98DRAFT_528759 [Cadophora sp. DSE1049]